MPNDEFAPNLNKLDRNYQILTELHRDGVSRTYLARHLGVNRDVTITVVGAGDTNDAALPHLASDARLLTAMRHPNIVPVIEGIWLDARTFAVVRARIRGSRVDQLIGKNGALPVGQVATTIQTVHDALSWARNNGIVHRRVTPSSVMFQQGNQRVMLTLELAPFIRGAIPDECDDVRTIGVLASDMMLGRITRAGEPVLAVSIPPHIVGAVTRSIVAVRRCHAGNAKQVVGSLLTELHSAAAGEPAAVEPIAAELEPSAVETVGAEVEPHEVEPLPVEPVGAEPVAIAAMAEQTQSGAELDHHYDHAVTVVESPFGFNARLGTAVAAAAIIGVLTVLSFRHRSPATNLSASVTPSDSHAQAAGDVSPGASKAATPRGTAALPPATASALGLNSRACRSPTAADQRTCLMAAIERNDVDMNAVYTKLIRALRRQSTAAAATPDPEPVTKLRRSQRKWSDDRDVVCRKVGTGPLYASERASCFAQWSADRARELQRMLDAVPPGH
jgi:uncharacterized protein YecT (DUF1311 family)